MKLIFATNNRHKTEEIQSLVPPRFTIITLREAGIETDIPEPHDTLEENAAEKAATIYRLTGQNCFSDDTGLEVESLNGKPGVHSARYAGEEKSFAKNVEKLLTRLKDEKNRTAVFRAVICLYWNGERHFFEGVCPGRITEGPRGSEGFGYDPVFVPEGAQKTFAEMSLAEKNKFSHRGKAIYKLVEFLNLLG